MTTLLAPQQLDAQAARAQALLQGLNRQILGQEELTKLVLIAFLAGGHVLLEGLPGLGKTELVKAFGRLAGLQTGRVQFTPDLLPADITGSPMLDDSGRTLEFRPGPVFTQLLLADEINRASPKTQAALLEAMAESAVTVAGVTRPLPALFRVLATQNPIEQDGTYPLPEAQLDRFALKLQVTGVDDDTLFHIVQQRAGSRPPEAVPVCDGNALLALCNMVPDIVLPDAVGRWISRLVNATRPDVASAPDWVREQVRWGASPRAALWLARGARAAALLAGRPSVGFDDVRFLAPSVLGHRVLCRYEAGLDGVDGHRVAQRLLETVAEV